MAERTLRTELEAHKGELVTPSSGGTWLVEDFIHGLESGQIKPSVPCTLQNRGSRTLEASDLKAQLLDAETGPVYLRIDADSPLYLFNFAYTKLRPAN